MTRTPDTPPGRQDPAPTQALTDAITELSEDLSSLGESMSELSSSLDIVGDESVCNLGASPILCPASVTLTQDLAAELRATDHPACEALDSSTLTDVHIADRPNGWVMIQNRHDRQPYRWRLLVPATQIRMITSTYPQGYASE